MCIRSNLAEADRCVRCARLPTAENSEKIVKSKKIEEIRLTILNTVLEYHPEAGEQIAWSAAAKAASEMDATNPLGAKK